MKEKNGRREIVGPLEADQKWVKGSLLTHQSIVHFMVIYTYIHCCHNNLLSVDVEQCPVSQKVWSLLNLVAEGPDFLENDAPRKF